FHVPCRWCTFPCGSQTPTSHSTYRPCSTAATTTATTATSSTTAGRRPRRSTRRSDSGSRQPWATEGLSRRLPDAEGCPSGVGRRPGERITPTGIALLSAELRITGDLVNFARRRAQRVDGPVTRPYTLTTIEERLIRLAR